MGLRRKGFTIIEVMIVVVIIGLLLGIAIPNYLNARTRTQKTTCISNQIEIDTAKELWAIENRMAPGTAVTSADLWPTYLRGPNFPICPSGGVYAIGVVNDSSSCSIVTHSH